VNVEHSQQQSSKQHSAACLCDSLSIHRKFKRFSQGTCNARLMSGIKAGITSEKLIYESHFIVRIAPETRKGKKIKTRPATTDSQGCKRDDN